MIFGNARVSKGGQDLAFRRNGLKAAGYDDIFSGRTADHPQVQPLMATLRQGDIIIIPTIDRLAGDPTGLPVIARDLQRAGTGLKSLAEDAVDLECQRILDWVRCGNAAAKARGVKCGRRPNLTPFQRTEGLARKAAGDLVRGIARSYAVSPITTSRLQPHV